MSVWFITGSSRGFGLEITRAALAAGHQVVATARKAETVREQFPDAEISRVLTDNGLFIVYDVMLLGDPTRVGYPLPWASEPEHSFLARPEEYRSLLHEAGFDIVAEHDHRAQAAQSLRDAGAPNSVAMGTDASTKLAKALRNIEDGLLAPTEMICRLR
ncbi:hypothetical protein [Streptomyces sp. NPDC047043]|uniref:hypothetical protein n=1 Tax=Streptomyces sp. NPDC047043 TaxID=3154497 RepID=UPI00340AF7D1